MKNLVFTLIATSIMVQPVSAKMTRLKHAHHHGSAKLGLVFDDTNGKLDFKVSADSILGFEHQPKTEKQKKLVETQYSLLENKISEMVVFAPDLGCLFTKEKIEREGDSAPAKKSKAEHSDIVAVFNIKCSKAPLGSVITFNFQNHFPNIHDIEAAVVAGDLQKSIKIKKSGVTLQLSK